MKRVEVRRSRWRVVVVAAAVGLAAAGVLLVPRAWHALYERPRTVEQLQMLLDISRADAAAPPFRHPTADGGVFSSAEHRGEVLFVNFWATWCPPCREEMPSMMALGRALAARRPGKFRMVAVSVDEGWEPVREFFGGRLPPDLAVTLDTDQATTKAYYCAARGECPESYKFPETYIVDPRGRLVAYVVGPRDWSDPVARLFLEELIDG